MNPQRGHTAGGALARNDVLAYTGFGNIRQVQLLWIQSQRFQVQRNPVEIRQGDLVLEMGTPALEFGLGDHLLTLIKLKEVAETGFETA